MKSSILAFVASAALLLFSVACSSNAVDKVSYEDGVKQALQQAELTNVSVSEDLDKNTVTLQGSVHSDDARIKAGEVARNAAGPRTVVNEVSVQPVGAEADAKNIASNLDGAIEKNYKAALISNGLNKQHIDFKAKNGVLVLTGNVKTAQERLEAQQVAANVPNVLQVLNQIDVKR